MPRYVDMMAPKPTWAKKFEAKGQALVGHLLTNPMVFYDPMATTANWLRTGSSIPTMSLNTQGGGIRMDTTAAAGQNSDVYQSNLAGAARSSILTRPSTEAWYMAWRASYDTAINNQAVMRAGLQDSGLAVEGVLIGVHGPTSTAKFVGGSGANTALSSVDFAPGVYDHEVWGLGTTTLLFRINGESPVALTYGDGALDGWAMKLRTENGAGGGQRIWRVTDVLAMTNGL